MEIIRRKFIVQHCENMPENRQKAKRQISMVTR